MKLHCSHCDKTFTAPDSWQDTKVRCPSCNQVIDTRKTESPAKSTPKPQAPSAPSTAKKSPPPSRPGAARPGAARPASPPATPNKPTRPHSPPPSPASHDDDEFQLSPEEARPTAEVFLESSPTPPNPESKRAAPGGRRPPPKPTARKPVAQGERPADAGRTRRPAASLAAEAKDSDDTSPPPKERPKPKPCPNCKAMMHPSATVCGSCGYHTVLKRVIPLEVNDKSLHETQGLDRWFRSMMEEGESLDSVFMLFHALLAVIGVVVAVFYHPWGWLALGVATVVYIGFLYLGSATGSYHRWSLWGWERLLGLYRRLGWRTLLPPFSARHCFVRHDLEFDDDQLMAMEDVFDYEVLDLEGTSVTDRSLLHLAGCERLQFVVLKGTPVTRKGVLRLQSMLPQVLVWS